MYIPYAAVYFVDRVYVACTLSNACGELTLVNYMTQEVIVMAASVLLHIPIWSLCLRIAEIQKSGGRTSEVFRFRKSKVETNFNAEECYGEFEDDDVRMERTKVDRICSDQTPSNEPPVVLVKVIRVHLFHKFYISNGKIHFFRILEKNLVKKTRVARLPVVVVPLSPPHCA